MERATFELGRDPVGPREAGNVEFKDADPATVCHVRLELERLRRRQMAVEASPEPQA